MFNFLKKFLKDQKGAMDKLIVTLLLVVFAIAAAMLLQNWMTDTVAETQESATTQIQEAIAGGN